MLAWIPDPGYDVTMKNLIDYTLADKALIEAAFIPDNGINDVSVEPVLQTMVFQPDRGYVILGQSNDIQSAVNIEACLQDDIAILKRPSGGESVYVSPQTVIVSFALQGKAPLKSKDVFSQALKAIILSLEEQAISPVEHRGISDLVLNGKKILGCAIYRKKDFILYHAVLNVAESPSRIAKYLLHPSREPDYRQGRSHEDFITSIIGEGFCWSFEEFKEAVTRNLTVLIG